MHLRILASRLHTIPLRTRIPFRYGIATMTEVPLVFLRIWLEIDGHETQGVASDCLPPKWFTKVPEKPLDEEIGEMRGVIANAQHIANGLAARSVFRLWRNLYEAQAAWASSRALPPLLANFGASLVERAVIDAFCRGRGQSFSALLKANDFELVLSELHPELAGADLSKLLPSAPLDRVVARHTIGLADALSEADIPQSERLHDGLPQSLEAAVRSYGLKHFKIKVTGRISEDLERISTIARIVQGFAPATYRFSLDGNEQFNSLAAFRDFWRDLAGDPALRGFFDHLLFVEQPLNRSIALDPGACQEFARWHDRPPIVIDESDGDIHALPAALELGYAGSSHKNCKGVFKGLANLALIAKRRATTGGAFFMTGEDLCNIGPVALQQDLAVMAAFGISSVERNGHHYHAGLSQFPPAVQRLVLAAHCDHYGACGAGWPALRIKEGEVSAQSINAAPFGSAFRSEDCELLAL